MIYSWKITWSLFSPSDNDQKNPVRFHEEAIEHFGKGHFEEAKARAGVLYPQDEFREDNGKPY